MIEPDEVFRKNGLNSVEDLVEKISPDDNNYTSSSNSLFQFVAYHIMEGKHFLNNFEGKRANYNTFSSLPIYIDGTGIDIKINTGVRNFDTVYSGFDTTIINFIYIDYDLSNVITKNGGIHVIKEIMEPFRPLPQSYNFQFYEEPLILSASQRPNTYEFTAKEGLQFLHWEGVKSIEYVKLGSNSGYSNDDYIRIEGEFTFSYEIPKILPGTYVFQILANANYYNNAFIKVFIDGKRVGGNIDLTIGTVRPLTVSTVSFNNYEKHVVAIQTLVPGRLSLDGLLFNPISGLY